MKLYTATWCSKCRQIKGFVSADVEIINVDDWSDDEISTLGLKGLPTLQTDDGELHPIVSINDLQKYGAKK